MANHHDHLDCWPNLWRMILARLLLDDEARQQVRDEIAGCAQCWAEIAEILVDLHANEMVIGGSYQGAVKQAEAACMGALDALARDRCEVEERSLHGTRAPIPSHLRGVL